MASQSSQLSHVFELREIDGRRLRSSGIATSAASQGQGFRQSTVTVTHKVPAAPSKVMLGAATQYAAPILAMTNPTCRVQGQVDFKPEPGKTYRVAGRIAAAACTVWIEDAESKKPVTAEVSGAGLK